MTPSPPPAPGRTILLVEDDPAHAHLIMRRLADTHPGLNLIHCADGEAALQSLEACRAGAATRPDMVLLDLRLPKVDGLDVLAHIKSADDLKGIPVVILTTSSDPSDCDEAYLRHANSYLLKPINYQEFSQMADNLCSYWLNWNRS